MMLSFLLLIIIFPHGNSYIFERPSAPLPELSQLVEAQSGRRLAVGLDIGKPEDISRLAISGIVFDLTKESPSFHDEVVKMPGIHGPKPLLSGGLHVLKTVQEGSFISMAGTETFKPLKGCWEIVWRNGAPAGTILCGFEIDKDYTRNAATLPKGTVYVSFNTWSTEGLKRAQDIKDRISERASNALRKKNDELSKMAETSNVFQKVRHYFNAFSAVEAYYQQPNHILSVVPDLKEVIHFESDMYVSMIGKVWTQSLPTGKPIILGTARMKSASKAV